MNCEKVRFVFVGRGCVVCLQFLLELVGVAEGVSPLSFNLGVSHS